MIIWLKQNLIDRNPLSIGNAEYQTRNFNFTYNLNLAEQKITFTVSANSTLTNTFYGKSGLSGVTLGASKTFLKNNSLSANTAITFNSTSFNKQAAGSVVNFNAGGAYKIAKHHSLTLNFFFISNHSTLSTVPSYHELTVTTGYVFHF